MLRLAGPFWDDVRPRLLEASDETCAVLFTTPAAEGRLLVTTGELAPDNAYLQRTRIRAGLAPAYLAEISQRARRGGFGVVMTHTHPFDTDRPRFSAIDDDGEGPMAVFFQARVPDRAHLAMVVSPGGLRARGLGAGVEVPVVEVGRNIVVHKPEGPMPAADPIYDRQVRAFGAAGQAALGALEVAIVGLGGTGSVVAQELALLGVRRFVLVDPDTLERTNRNRVFGAQAEDVGKAKVVVAAANIARINPEAMVEALAQDVLTVAGHDRLARVDAIFLCTDSHASRAMVSQLAYQHLIPAWDMGVAIGVDEGQVRDITGRVQMLAPGLACLVCSQVVDSNAVRRELMSAEHRAADPYFNGAGEPQPAVAALNATVSSLAVSMFMGAITGAPLQARYQWYDAVSGKVRTPGVTPKAHCLVCSGRGALGKGASGVNPLRGVK